MLDPGIAVVLEGAENPAGSVQPEACHGERTTRPDLGVGVPVGLAKSLAQAFDVGADGFAFAGSQACTVCARTFGDGSARPRSTRSHPARPSRLSSGRIAVARTTAEG